MIYQHWLNGKEVLFFDRDGLVYRTNGVDHNAAVRKAIGR